MVWKNKHFDQEAVFKASREIVFEIAGALAAESLHGWQVEDTPDCFMARWRSASHAATAKFRIEPVPSGTEVAVELLAQRAGPLGIMLFDVGGYYNGQFRKSLSGISRDLGNTFATRP